MSSVRRQPSVRLQNARPETQRRPAKYYFSTDGKTVISDTTKLDYFLRLTKEVRWPLYCSASRHTANQLPDRAHRMRNFSRHWKPTAHTVLRASLALAGVMLSRLFTSTLFPKHAQLPFITCRNHHCGMNPEASSGLTTQQTE